MRIKRGYLSSTKENIDRSITGGKDFFAYSLVACASCGARGGGDVLVVLKTFRKRKLVSSAFPRLDIEREVVAEILPMGREDRRASIEGKHWWGSVRVEASRSM